MLSPHLAGSSVGSDIFAIACLASISLAVLLVLRYFLPLRTTPAYLTTSIFLALVLPASIIVLVPIDLASSARTDSGGSRGVWLAEPVLRTTWRICYWLTFSLTWFILPLLGEYVDAGYLAPKERLMYSLRSNARYQLTLLACGIIGLVYFFISLGVSPTSLKALVISLAYCWGLFLAIYLMGHGLVTLPRRFFRNADIAGRLRRLEARAPKLHDRMQDSLEEMEKLEAQIRLLGHRKNNISGHLLDWVDELTEITGLPEARVPNELRLPVEPSIPTVITEKYLAELTRKFRRENHRRARFVEEWDRLLDEASRVQLYLDSAASHRVDLGQAGPRTSPWRHISLLTPFTRHLLHYRIMPILRYGFGIFLTMASISIIWSELIKFSDPKLSLITYTIVHHPSSDRGQIGFAGQLIAGAWLVYMCVAALISITEVKVWGNRALVRRNTYGESACWYASQIAKLTVPLAYNFIGFIPPPISRSTAFYNFLGRPIDRTSLSQGFNNFFPILILFPVLATLFNLYGKVKRWFGFGLIDDEDDDENPSEFGTEGWREGRNLIERERSGNTSLLIPRLSPNPTSTSSPARGARAAPTLWVPPAEWGVSTRNVPDRTAERRNVRERLAAEEAEEDDNPFSDLGRRIKNTFDATERPQWMKDLGDNFKTPKWMGGDEGSESGASRGIVRWMGGRSSEGRIRL